MTVGDLSDPSAVEKALAEFDRLGRRAFLKKYGYGMAHSWMVVKDGRGVRLKGDRGGGARL